MTEWKPIRTSALADLLGGSLHGDGSIELRSIDTLDAAGPGVLSWMGNAQYAGKLAGSNAGCVLVPLEISPPAGRTVIRVKDPDLALTVALQHMAPQPPRVATGVHPTATVCAGARVDGACIGAGAYVGEGATIGSGAQLHPGAYVGAFSSVGRDCVLWPGVVVRERCRIGDRVILHPNCVIGADGFGYLFRGGKHVKVPQVGTVQIDDDVEIGAGSTVDRAKSGVTRIRRGTKIDNLVQIGHNCDIGEDCIVVAQVGISGSVTTGHHCVFGGQVGIADHLRIGNGVQFGAQSGVMRDVTDGETLLGTPADERRASLQREVATRKLPEALAELRALAKRIEQLESAADDRKRM